MEVCLARAQGRKGALNKGAGERERDQFDKLDHGEGGEGDDMERGEREMTWWLPLLAQVLRFVRKAGVSVPGPLAP